MSLSASVPQTNALPGCATPRLRGDIEKQGFRGKPSKTRKWNKPKIQRGFLPSVGPSPTKSPTGVSRFVHLVPTGEAMMMAKIDPTLPHYEVRKFLAGRPNGNADTDGRIAELLGWPVGPAYSTDLNAVVGQLSKTGWWWHLSHIEATVIPTRDADGPLKGLVSNGARYDREGNPIEYVDAFAKGRPAMALCSAAIRATYDLPEALHVVASHSAHVLSKKPQSTEHRMAYYRAREHYRLEAIAAWEAENPQ